MQYLMKWGMKEIYANKVNDEENVVEDINEVCKNKIIIKNEVSMLRKKPDKTLPQLVYMSSYLTMVQVEIFLLCTSRN